MKTSLQILNAHALRYVEAIALGEVADILFAEECLRRGLALAEGLRAPLDSVSIPASHFFREGSDARH